MTQKIITVFGATGNQGGSTVAAILSRPELSSKYKIRAITRDPSKPSAQKLADKGAELAKADLNDIASVRSAIAGSYGVFAVTNYWETTSKTVEFQQGKNIVDACKDEGVKHLVWSNLPNTTKLTDGELSKIEHFDSKAEVGEYAEKVKGDMIVSYFMPAFFMSNLTQWIQPDKDTGVVTLSQPWNPTQTWIPMLDIQRDTGVYTAGLFEAGSKANGVSVQAVSEWLHPKDLTDQLSEITGKKVTFVEKPGSVESAAKLGDRIGEELEQNMLLIRDFSYYGKGAEKKQAESDEFLVAGAKKTTWKEFCEGVKWQFA
ncbi:NmrA-like family-domain-containing protein [Exophiala viscosa]|uniref:NmrA-like family-domain-containing protein n=1 Tax=Exophiala viscosa TaxID=2486360 RepID=A0AAN6E444_9EURO|nr:NmrA-like family-domain-containing protein [Exophiala viscosa]KAI1629656.1 NmrA-like family-domain-containing protein [Exophiala viscosa]